jgi:hydrogenase expression/formation protein HypE
MEFDLTCPLPNLTEDRVLLAHGGGGRLTQRLIERVFLPAFGNAALAPLHDGAILTAVGARLAFTTDSFVVSPLFFPGGSIGDLAVFGTANDLAMCGARPRYLSAGFILEEGLPMDTLHRVVAAMKSAAEQASIAIVTGDTKVVDKGKGDGIFINTAGIGSVEYAGEIGPGAVQPGDVVIVSGDLGRHGMAILSVREGLEFESAIESDAALLWPAVEALIGAGVEIHCLRDLTRGGLASALNEIAASRGVAIEIAEAAIPVNEVVRGACEILGLDALYVVNEGRFAAIVPARHADLALATLRSVPVSSGAVRIGVVEESPANTVLLRTQIGGRRVVDMLSGEQLPRIC